MNLNRFIAGCALLLVAGTSSFAGTCQDDTLVPLPTSPPGTDCNVSPALCGPACTVETCPAFDTCVVDAQCPDGWTCIPFSGGPGEQCLPSACFCEVNPPAPTDWACTDDCAGMCAPPPVVPGSSPQGMAWMAVVLALALAGFLVLHGRRRSRGAF